MADDRTDAREALERVLAFAELNGEVYVGAIEDHKTIRAAMAAADDHPANANPVAETDETGETGDTPA